MRITRLAMVVATMVAADAAVFMWAARQGIPGDNVLPIAVASAGLLAVAAVPLRLPQGDSVQASTGVAMAATLLLDPSSALLASFAAPAASLLLYRDQSETLPRALLDSARVPLLVALFVQVRVGLLAASRVDAEGLGVLILYGLLFGVADILSYALVTSLGYNRPFGSALTSMLQMVGTVYAAQISVGLAAVVVWPAMGLAGGAALLVLMLVMKHSMGMLLRVRSALSRTVAVLARLGEIERSEKQGHAERVARTAGEMGRQLGMTVPQLRKLELAALLHDIGAVNEVEPEAIPAASGEILRRAHFLDELGPIVEAQNLPASQMQQLGRDAQIAQVVRVASDYDDLLASDECTPIEAVGMMGVTGGSHYSERVLAALRSTVLEYA